MMNGINRLTKVQFLLLVFSFLALPMIVLGDVHFENQNHRCERVQHGIGSDLPWHPHEACDSKAEDSHIELKMPVQKNQQPISIGLLPVVTIEAVQNHDDCSIVTQTSKIYNPASSEILKLNSTFLI